MNKLNKKNLKYLWLLLPIGILIYWWWFTNNYEIYDYRNFKVTFYPNKNKPRFVKAYRIDNNGKKVEDYIFIRVFSRWWEYNFIDSLGFFVDEIEFNGGNMTSKNSYVEEVKTTTPKKETSANNAVDAK